METNSEMSLEEFKRVTQFLSRFNPEYKATDESPILKNSIYKGMYVAKFQIIDIVSVFDLLKNN